MTDDELGTEATLSCAYRRGTWVPSSPFEPEVALPPSMEVLVTNAILHQTEHGKREQLTTLKPATMHKRVRRPILQCYKCTLKMFLYVCAHLVSPDCVFWSYFRTHFLFFWSYFTTEKRSHSLKRRGSRATYLTPVKAMPSRSYGK